MKQLVFCLLAVSVWSLSVGCGGNEEVRTKAREAIEASQPAPPDVTSTNTAGASAVKHYICPNNCAGSGGDVQGTCPVCGTAYVHNQAYHNQTQQTPNPAQSQQPAPAQNAAGEYHYICSAGCGTGAGTQGTCPKCGAPLAHNQAYHAN